MIGFGFSVFTQAILGLGGGFRGSALNLDFTSGNRTLDPRITFSRTTNATVTGSNGLIQNAPMNLLTFSEQFDNAAWLKVEVSSAANTSVAPNGTTTADTLIPSTNTVSHYAYQTIALTSGLVYSYSVYAKPSGYNRFLLRESTSSGAAVAFDVSTGTVVGTLGATGTITPAENGFYRCTMTFTAPATGSFVMAMVSLSNTGTSWATSAFAGNGTSGVFLWGAQLELGSTATTYNPTTVKNLLGFTEHFDNAAWTKSNAFVQTNLFTYSQNFDDAAWTKTATTVTANTEVAPDGTTTAEKAVATATASTYRWVRQSFGSFVSGVTYTFSVFAKSSEYTKVYFSDANAGSFACAFDLTAGTAGTPSGGFTGLSASITNVGGGWYRCSLTFTANASGGRTPAVFGYPNSGVTLDTYGAQYAGDGTSGLFLWGAQLVQGTSAGDYKATYAAAAAVGYTDIYGQPFAQKLNATTATGDHTAFAFPSSFVAGAPYVFSYYAKAAEYTKTGIRIGGAGYATTPLAVVDLTNGSILSQQGFTSLTVQSVGSGWYRVSGGLVSGTGLTPNIQPLSDSYSIVAGNFSYTGDGTSGIYIFGAQLSDSASVDPYVYQPVAAPTSTAYYGPRFDYDPVTLAPKGLLIEEQRSNLLLNSAALSTQVVTVAATAHTLSFYGTGTIVLSGASTGTVVGTGAYPARTTLTFTPTVGVLTLTVTGSVTMAQLEAGAFATSYIPTVASQVTRAADNASMIGNNFARWYNQNTGTAFIDYATFASGSITLPVMEFSDGTTSNRTLFQNNPATNSRVLAFVGGSAVVTTLDATAAAQTKVDAAYSVGSWAASYNGAAALTNSYAGVVPNQSQLIIGYTTAGGNPRLNGTIKRIAYYNRRLSNTELQGITS